MTDLSDARWAADAIADRKHILALDAELRQLRGRVIEIAGWIARDRRESDKVIAYAQSLVLLAAGDAFDETQNDRSTDA